MNDTHHRAHKTSASDAHQQWLASEREIEALAKQTHTEIAFVRELYTHEHARLASQAKIKTYVTVIATRLVREQLATQATRMSQ